MAACFKLAIMIIYYVPFILLLTHNYPITEHGCVVKVGSLMCEQAESVKIPTESTVDFRFLKGGGKGSRGSSKKGSGQEAEGQDDST